MHLMVCPRSPNLKPRTCDQIVDRARDQNLVWTRKGTSARTPICIAIPITFVTGHLAFAGAHLKSQARDAVAHRTDTSNRASRSIKSGEQAVAGGINLTAVLADFRR